MHDIARNCILAGPKGRPRVDAVQCAWHKMQSTLVSHADRGLLMHIVEIGLLLAVVAIVVDLMLERHGRPD